MGEIDTKPIEPVQVAITLFGEKGDQKKHRSSNSEEMEKEKDMDVLLKDLANYKVQLEAKEFAYLQLLHSVEQNQKTTGELSTLLKNCATERDVCMEECLEARGRIDELECKIKEMADQLSETGKIREQLSHVLSELKATQGELLSMETELVTATEAKAKALTRVENMETAASMEKDRAEELSKRVDELNETIIRLKLEAIEAEKEKCMAISEKDAQVDLATQKAIEAEEQIEDARRRLEGMQELENQLLAKYEIIESLQEELTQAKELLSSSNYAVSDLRHELNHLKESLKDKEVENYDQAIHIRVLESELNQLRFELKNANDEVTRLNCNVETLTDELVKVKAEMDSITEKENEAQVEIALLKAEVHKGKSELAAAKAAEARAGNLKSGLYLAVQKLAVEAEEAKKENQRLKQGVDQAIQECATEESGEEVDERRNENDDSVVTISLEEYESLVRKSDKFDSNHSAVTDNKYELEALKKELEAATAKIADFRTRSEQAVSRAEAAEKAKLALEDQLRKWREHKQRRRAAIAALREESSPRELIAPTHHEQNHNMPKTYQPLGKVLNMKF